MRPPARACRSRSSTPTSTSGIRRVNYYPWLNDEPPIPFRYGDYRAIRRRYLPPDYLADAAPFRVEKTVYVETEWDPRDPVGEMRYVERCAASTGCRRSPSRRRGSTTTTRRACSSSRRRSTSCAASATSRAPIRRPATARPAA